MSEHSDPLMWTYQRHFRVNQEYDAENVFKLLDQRFEPEVFLVGIRYEMCEGRCLAGVEPDKDFWIPAEAFDGTLALAAALAETGPEAKALPSRALAELRPADAAQRRSVADAIVNIIDQHPGRSPHLEYAASLPERVEGFWVSVVLGLQRDVLAAHRHLSRNHVALHKSRELPVSRSLVDAAVAEFFNRSAEQLRMPEAGLAAESADAEELLRAAARQFATEVAFRADPSAIEGLHGFFRACITISSLKYEQAVGMGRMVVARKDHDALRPRVSFGSAMKLDDFRGARKMLELASRGAALHTNSKDVFGLVDCLRYDPKREDLFEVNFLGHHHWELLHAGEILMRVKYGQPYLPNRSEYETKLLRDLPRIFPGIAREKIGLLVSLVRAAEKEKHGTMLVFHDRAAEEAHRLKAQGTPINCLPLTPELVPHLTPIDGAAIIDPAGCCHAIGVILDGMASAVGDPSRGARYNSALRYVSSSPAGCLVVVISEDGGVDLVPNLRPAVRRSTIEKAVRELETLAQAAAIPRRHYVDCIEWLSSHRFYLLKQHCEAVNRDMQTIEDRLAKEDPSAMRIIRAAFKADSRMDEQLYYEAEGTPGEKGTKKPAAPRNKPSRTRREQCTKEPHTKESRTK